MKGLSKVLDRLLEGNDIVNVDELTAKAMESEEIDEEGAKLEDFKKDSYSAKIVSGLNARDYYSIGKGEYAYIKTMTAEQLQKVRNRLKKVIRSMRKTVKQLDGQIAIISTDCELHIPDPVKIEKEKES